MVPPSLLPMSTLAFASRALRGGKLTSSSTARVSISGGTKKKWTTCFFSKFFPPRERAAGKE